MGNSGDLKRNNMVVDEDTREFSMMSVLKELADYFFLSILIFRNYDEVKDVNYAKL